MSVLALAWAWQQSLPATAKLILLALPTYADEEGYCQPELAVLASMCRCNESTVVHGMNQLIDQDLLEVRLAYNLRDEDHVLYSYRLKLAEDAISVANMGSGDNLPSIPETAAKTEEEA